jgi:ABC-type glycerol-3-phosphate transport system substrate-binding protein
MKMRPFELGLVLVFGLMGLLALALLSTYKPADEEVTVAIAGPVEIWGTLPGTAFYKTMAPLLEGTPAYRNISYVEKDPRTFDQDLIEALADNRGPDIILLPHEKLVTVRSKIQVIPYENFPLRDFRDLYIDGAEIFARPDGIYAYPVAIDPLVMYWNRDVLGKENIITAPDTWEEIVNDVVPTFVERDFNRNITRSPIAFGEYRNVSHAYEILSMLLIQSGSSLVSEGIENYRIELNQSAAGRGNPLESALTFYTNFASPSNPLYSWNRARPLDREAFLSGDLILYFGKGSEVGDLAAQNPNLNFDMAEVPQGASATTRRTYGSFYGLALLRSSDNKSSAYTVLQQLGSQSWSTAYASALGMAPAYRSALLAGSNDTYGRIIFEAAISARGWLTPSLAAVDSVFIQMVEDVLANRSRPTEAGSDAVVRLGREY